MAFDMLWTGLRQMDTNAAYAIKEVEQTGFGETANRLIRERFETFQSALGTIHAKVANFAKAARWETEDPDMDMLSSPLADTLVREIRDVLAAEFGATNALINDLSAGQTSASSNDQRTVGGLAASLCRSCATNMLRAENVMLHALDFLFREFV